MELQMPVEVVDNVRTKVFLILATRHNWAAKRIRQHGAAMLKFLFLTGAILLIADTSFAQSSPDPTPSQCQLIRLAVAQYGFAAARRHALETYGPEAVKTGDKCFLKRTGRSSNAPTPIGVERGTAVK
jgi:hypothetical protein